MGEIRGNQVCADSAGPTVGSLVAPAAQWFLHVILHCTNMKSLFWVTFHVSPGLGRKEEAHEELSLAAWTTLPQLVAT